jgi:hypothetical protein
VLKQRYNLILYTIFISLIGHSQERQCFTFDLGVSQNYKGFFTLYKGIIDAGGSYNQKIVGRVFAGASFHVEYLKRTNTTSWTIIYKPKINLQYNLKVTPKIYLTTLVAIGYSFVSLSNKEYSYQEMQHGVNPEAELRFSWRTSGKTDYYLFCRYDYIYLAKDENFTHLEYYRRLQLTSFGLGIKIKRLQESKL